MTAQTLFYNLFITAIVIVGLYLGKFLLLPFVIAIVVWYLLNSVGDLFGKIRINKKVIGRNIQLLLGFMLVFIVSFFIVKLVSSNYQTFLEDYPKYHDNFLVLTASIQDEFDLNFFNEDWIKSLDLPLIFGEALNSSFDFMSTFVLVLLYVIFLLIEQKIMPKKIRQIYPDRDEYRMFLRIIRKIDESIYAYVSIKTSLCLIAGILSYLTLIIIGVDFAFLWGFLIFMLSFIPIIGSFIGILFPTIIALLQFGGFFEPVLVLILLSAIQLIIGNFVEPKMLGSKLNVSPLVVIIALSFWGALWGIAGMFLCVPITVIMIIIFSQFEKTRAMAIMLSGGKVIQ